MQNASIPATFAVGLLSLLWRWAGVIKVFGSSTTVLGDDNGRDVPHEYGGIPQFIIMVPLRAKEALESFLTLRSRTLPSAEQQRV